MYTSDLQVLSAPNLASGYHGVYEHPRPDRPGNKTLWVAVPFRKQKLSAIFHTPREAAKAVAAKWREMYGPEWHRIFIAREQTPWVLTARSGTQETIAARYCGRGQWESVPITRGGFHLFAWELGDKIAVWPPVRKTTCFHTRRCALAGLRFWAFERAGLFAPIVLRRAEGGPVYPPWVNRVERIPQRCYPDSIDAKGSV